MVMIGDHRAAADGDAVNLHQMLQGPRILGNQHIGPGKHIQRPQRDVARRPDWRGNQVQPRRNCAGVKFQRGCRQSRQRLHKFTSLCEPITLTRNSHEAAE
jgi:hypothetical protein